MKKALLLWTLLLVSGCATSTSRYTNQKAPDSATLLPRHPPTGVAVIIAEVDGHPTGGSAFTTVYVSAGTRMIGFHLRNWGTGAANVVPVEVVAGRTYDFTAEFTGAAFTLKMFDQMDGRQVASWRFGESL